MFGRFALALLLAVLLLAACDGDSASTPIPTDVTDVTAVDDVAASPDAVAEPDVVVTTDGGTPDSGEDTADASPPRLSTRACLLDPDCDRVMVAAHRGGHTELPENSLAALRAAVALGADFTEIDVRPTSDGVLVLMHDSDVDRTTDGSGEVAALSWAEVQALTLDGGDPADPESLRVPTFTETLALARELDTMLYVDVKTDRQDLLLADIAADEYYDVALVRDGYASVAQMLASDPALLVLAAVDDAEDFAEAIRLMPEVPIVEIAQSVPLPELTATIREAGVKVQQDVLAWGDVKAIAADYSGWGDFVEAGVHLLQTNLPELLVPLVEEYERTGVFPE